MRLEKSERISSVRHCARKFLNEFGLKARSHKAHWRVFLRDIFIFVLSDSETEGQFPYCPNTHSSQTEPFKINTTQKRAMRKFPLHPYSAHVRNITAGPNLLRPDKPDLFFLGDPETRPGMRRLSCFKKLSRNSSFHFRWKHDSTNHATGPDHRINHVCSAIEIGLLDRHLIHIKPLFTALQSGGEFAFSSLGKFDVADGGRMHAALNG